MTATFLCGAAFSATSEWYKLGICCHSMPALRYLVLALVAVGVTAGCRTSPVAPSTGPSLNDLARQTNGPGGTDVGNRILFPQSGERPRR